jgi:NH3-dependent NAD+ synthetase
MGITYAELDRALAAMDAGQGDDVDADLLAKVQEMVARSEHKRHLPPACHF